MNDLLEQGITALQNGDKIKARRLFSRAIQAHPQSEQVWLWLSGAVDSEEERLMCLNKVLALNPGNEAARQGVSAIRQKQASRPTEAVAAFPWIPRPTAERPRPAQPTFYTLDHSCTLDQLPPEQRQALEGFTQLVAQELVSRRSRKEIIERLIKRGFPRTAVKQFVNGLAPASFSRDRMLRRRRYGKMMITGLFLTLFGVGGTVVTYIVAQKLGSSYLYIYYGAIFIGLVNFVIGFIGWSVNQF